MWQIPSSNKIAPGQLPPINCDVSEKNASPVSHEAQESLSVPTNEDLKNYRDTESSIDTLVCCSRPFSMYVRRSRGVALFIQTGVVCLCTALLWFIRPPGADRFAFVREHRAGDLAIGLLWFRHGLAALITSFFAHQGNTEVAKRVLVASGLFSAIEILHLFLAYLLIDKEPLLAMATLCFVTLSVWANNLITEENVIIRLAWIITFNMVYCTPWFIAFGDHFWSAIHGLQAVLNFFTASYLHWRRHKALLSAVGLVADDMRKYDEIWSKICSGQAESLKSLETTSLKISKHITPGQDSQPSLDLGTLFDQATRLSPVLHAKVQSWSEETGGKAYLAPTKKADRAVQKIMRSYQGNPQRLCDLCRASVVFPDIQSLLVALECIAADCDVQIVRLKNRFASGYCAERSAGYRDLCLLLKVQTKEARQQNIDRHCCELQLQVEDFFTAKTGGGHQRYVKWRNLRCE